jgi:hypothetical protein
MREIPSFHDRKNEDEYVLGTLSVRMNVTRAGVLLTLQETSVEYAIT